MAGSDCNVLFSQEAPQAFYRIDQSTWVEAQVRYYVHTLITIPVGSDLLHGYDDVLGNET